jgi:hypothetical protein
MQQFSNMGGGREVWVRQYTAPHAGDSETAVWENRIFSCLTKTACYKEVEITFENAYWGVSKTLTLAVFYKAEHEVHRERHYNHKYSAGNRRRRINFN